MGGIGGISGISGMGGSGGMAGIGGIGGNGGINSKYSPKYSNGRGAGAGLCANKLPHIIRTRTPASTPNVFTFMPKPSNDFANLPQRPPQARFGWQEGELIFKSRS
jgi:hypothetical protein